MTSLLNRRGLSGLGRSAKQSPVTPVPSKNVRSRGVCKVHAAAGFMGQSVVMGRSSVVTSRRSRGAVRVQAMFERFTEKVRLI